MATNWDKTRLDHRSRQSDAIAEAALALLLEGGASALTMAAVASAAGISRQTLYRYFPDIDAVLVAIAELIAAHDDHLATLVAEQPNPMSELDVVVATVTHASGHGEPGTTALQASLPPEARKVLARHEAHVTDLVSDILRRGIDQGLFTDELEPASDARLILGLAAAAEPQHHERALRLVHRIVQPNTEPNTQPKEPIQ